MCEGQEIDIVQHFFPNHPLLRVCICWSCWIPQDGATPLFVSAYNGDKEVVEVLLHNGAAVNAARKVICDNAETWFRKMQIRVLEVKCRVQEWNWQWQTAFCQWSIAEEVDELSFWVCTSMHRGQNVIHGAHSLACFSCSYMSMSALQRLICAWRTFSWRCLAQGMKKSMSGCWWVLRVWCQALLVNLNMDHIWILFQTSEICTEHCFCQTFHAIGMFWDICGWLLFAIRKSMFIWASMYMCYGLMELSMCLCFCLNVK